MILSFTYNESLLERSAVVNHVEDVEECTGVVLDINDISSDLEVKRVRFRSCYLLAARRWFGRIANVATMCLSRINVLLRNLSCSQHLYQRVLRQMSEVAMQSPDNNACSAGQRQPQLLALRFIGRITG